jgi:hypothetical protein
MSAGRAARQVLRLGILAMAILCAGGSVAAEPKTTVLDRVAASVFQLRCGNQTGSGFAWGESESVVTAFHLVTECQDGIEIHSASRNATRRGRVVRVLQSRDLALVQIVQISSAPWTVIPLDVSPADPAIGDSLTVLGHPLGVPTVQSATVKRKWGGKRIRDLVPSPVYKQLAELGWPDLSAEVHSFGDGHIVPGHSGGPIIDDLGRVASIANGGLENGAVEIAWGIPASNLVTLRQSTRSTPVSSARVRVMFGADIPVPAERRDVGFRCGSTNLQWIRKRNLYELAMSTDDPLGLQQLVNVLSHNGQLFNAYSFGYDIYRDLESGATIVVPSNLPLRPTVKGDLCFADDPDWGLTLSIQVDRVNNYNQAVAVAQAFEKRVLAGYQPFVDPNFTYIQPISRWDGLLVNRKALILNSYVPPFPDAPPQSIPTAYFFETLATRATGTLAFAVTKRGIDFDHRCGAGGGFDTDPRCVKVLPRHLRYAHMVLGIHLSTFPPG